LKIDGTIKDSAVIGYSSLNADVGYWSLFHDVPYTNYYRETINGSEVLRYQPDTIILGTDLLDIHNTQGGIITWGSNPSGVAINTGGGTSSGLAVYSGSGVAPAGTFLNTSPDMPFQMYQELDTSKIPGGEIIAAIFGYSETPIALWWFPLIYIGIAIMSMLFYELTTAKGQVEGSLTGQFIVIEALLVFFGVLGTTGVSGMIPLFGAFLFPIPATALIMSKKHYSWG
jgi:hypothetical protein